jgi:hypothetical protein
LPASWRSLRLLKEHELGVRIEHEEGDPFVRPNGK